MHHTGVSFLMQQLHMTATRQACLHLLAAFAIHHSAARCSSNLAGCTGIACAPRLLLLAEAHLTYPDLLSHHHAYAPWHMILSSFRFRQLCPDAGFSSR